MAKKEKNKKKKKKYVIDFDSFQNDKSKFSIVSKIIKLSMKYEGMGLAEMISKVRTGALLRDKVTLSAMNVALSVEFGKAEGAFVKAHGLRKSKTAEFYLDAKEEAENDGSKVTDKTADYLAEKRAKKYRLHEAKSQELSSVLSNLMYRTTKLVDTLDSAIQILEAERKRTE